MQRDEYQIAEEINTQFIKIFTFITVTDQWKIPHITSAQTKFSLYNIDHEQTTALFDSYKLLLQSQQHNSTKELTSTGYLTARNRILEDIKFLINIHSDKFTLYLKEQSKECENDNERRELLALFGKAYDLEDYFNALKSTITSTWNTATNTAAKAWQSFASHWKKPTPQQVKRATLRATSFPVQQQSLEFQTQNEYKDKQYSYLDAQQSYLEAQKLYLNEEWNMFCTQKTEYPGEEDQEYEVYYSKQEPLLTEQKIILLPLQEELLYKLRIKLAQDIEKYKEEKLKYEECQKKFLAVQKEYRINKGENPDEDEETAQAETAIDTQFNTEVNNDNLSVTTDSQLVVEEPTKKQEQLGEKNIRATLMLLASDLYNIPENTNQPTSVRPQSQVLK